MSQLQIGEPDLRTHPTNLLPEVAPKSRDNDVDNLLQQHHFHCHNLCTDRDNIACVFSSPPRRQRLQHLVSVVISTWSRQQRRPRHQHRRQSFQIRVNTVSNNPRGVPRLGLSEGSTWATIGPARRRGDRPERGSGAGAPTLPIG